jgi:hypothetical protein
VGLIAVTMSAMWAITTFAVEGGTFNILNTLKGGNMAAWGWAYSIASGIASAVNSWWGLAMAVALAAGIGMSWLAVAVRAMIQKVGFGFAVRWATYL